MIGSNNARDEIRANPTSVFGYNDIRGAENAFKSLLHIFSQEASKGHGDTIKVTMQFNGTITIEFEGNRVLNLGELNANGIEWKKRLVDCNVETMDYVEFLFSKEEVKSKPKYDETYDFAILACNMYASEFMGVAVVESDDSEKFKYISFENGEVSKILEDETDRRKGTLINIRYDNEVFSDVEISKEYIEACLDEAALLNPGIKYGLFCEELEESYNCQVFYYEHISDYIKKMSKSEYSDTVIYDEIEATYSTEKTVSGSNNYSVKLRIAFDWIEEEEAKNLVYFNQVKIDNADKILNAFFAGLQQEVFHYEELFRSSLNNCPSFVDEIYIPIRKLKKHVNLVIDIRTVDCIENRNIINSKQEIKNQRLIDLINNLDIIDWFVTDNIGRIEGWWASSVWHDDEYHGGVFYFPSLEDSLEDYENGDGKGDFICCLTNMERSEMNFSILLDLIHKEVCNKEPFYYYVLLTDFAKYITDKEYEILVNSYKTNIGKFLPGFFDVGEKFEKLFNSEDEDD